MAQHIPCCLPKFGTASDRPKRPASMRIRLSPSQSTQLLSAWRQDELSAVLQAAWALLLRCYTGSEDVCFGYQHIDVDNRPSINGVRSNVANLSILRLAVDAGDSVHAIVEKARNDQVVDRSNLSGSMTAVADGYLLFNTILLIRTYNGPSENIHASSLQTALAFTLPTECRARVHVKAVQENISIFLEWWNHDMSAEQMKNIAKIFEQLLAIVLSTEDMAVGELDLFTERDWHRICSWNASLPESHERCVHEVIHDQALLRPDSEAVCAWDGTLSYKELDYLASKLASHLQMLNVAPEARVALCFDKSKWNIVAMIGVLKAGGAFVPLDPSHPIPRLQALTKAVGANIVLCSQRHADNLRIIAETVIPLGDDTLEELLKHQEDIVASSGVNSRNAAYIIFTSGSTGEPKGTLLEHGAYCSSAVAHAPRLLMSHESRVLQFAAHTFDSSLVESLTPLMHGACVCIPSEESRLNDIVAAIKHFSVNLAILTPSFIEFVDSSAVPELKTLVLAGEAMSPSHLATWSKINLINGYGPTESAVSAVINSKITETSDSRDIGLPVGVRCWLVDPQDHDRLVPVGCPGELLLEGPTLARCYLNNPQKTAESFIYDPAWTKNDVSNGPNRRFYKTGDLVRYNSDVGSLTYIGRKDRQVKLHGQRVELGEIESHLNADSHIKHAQVFVPKAGFAKGRLVAVTTLSTRLDEMHESSSVPLNLLKPSAKKAPLTAIRERLSLRLPTYMVPSVWLCVEGLPLLTSGKLDRKAVANWLENIDEDPDLANSINEVKDQEVDPKNEVEHQIALIWSRVLNIPKDRLSMGEGFLRLGGDSIAAMTCMAQCKKHGIGLTVQEILRSKSIRDLATQVKAIDLSTVYQESVEEPFDLSPIQTLHFQVRNEQQGHFNQSILTRLNEEISESDLRMAIETLVMRHSMLRARFSEPTPEEGPKQRITQDIAGSYRLRVHNTQGQDEIHKAVADSQTSVNCFVGPVLAIDFFQVSGQHQLLSMVAHHLVIDIVSWRIILEDLEDLLLNPKSSSSQNCSLPFQTWCRLQADQCEELETEGNAARDNIPPPDFAYWGMEDCSITYGDVNCKTFEIDAETTSVIMTECHSSLRTEPVDLLLAALFHSFGQTFDNRPLPVIYNEGHGREPWDSTIDISRTVGWFTIVHPILLADLSVDHPSETVVRVKDLRRRVTDNGRAAFASRTLLGKKNGKGLHHGPMEITFNYVGQHRDLQRDDGLFQLVEQMAGETSQGGGAADFGQDTPRFGLFEISAVVVQGRLRFTFSFNKFMRHQELVLSWVSRCHDILKVLANRLLSLTPRLTLSDFPLLSLTYEELEAMTSIKLPNVGINSLDLIEDIYPCSRMQQGVLLSRSRDTSLYAAHGTFEVKRSERSEPNVDQLTRAWKEVVAHHSILRTIFVENLTTRDQFCQVVLKNYDSSPIYVQCSVDDNVLTILNRQEPMDYGENRPAHQFTICQTPTGKLFCRLELSHAVMDGASISMIIRDLQLAYASKLEERRRPLFKNFISYLQDRNSHAGINYWCTYLSDLRPCNFPVLNGGQEARRHLRSRRLRFEGFSELRSLCEANGVTISSAFNAAWGLTLSCFCNSEDVCFSYTASLRDAPVEEIESMVGPVMNLIVCRMKASSTSRLLDVLSQIQNDYMEALPHRHSSLIDIQHALKLRNKTLFNTGVSYQKLPAMGTDDGSGIRISELGPIHDPAEFPIYVNIEATEKDARIELNYWTDTLSDGHANNVASIFLQSLGNIVRHPTEEIGQLDNLSEQHKEQILRWNNTVPDSIDTCIPEAFEVKARMRPEAPAITAGGEDISYSTLSNLSSRLAGYLQQLGVGFESPVPICFDRSSWAIISILAVLKAGGICLPIDTIHTNVALEEWMLNNDVQVALASPTRVHLLEGTIPYVIPVSDSLFQYLPVTGLSGSAPSQCCPSDAAYVVITTGTSGKPKGVVLEHRAILTSAREFAEGIGINADTRMFQFSDYTTYSFLQEVFGTFSHGGCVCVPPSVDLNGLARAINDLRANFVQMTPSAAAYIKPSEVPGVRSVAFTGDSLTTRVKRMWENEVELYVLYGAAEFFLACIRHSDPGKSDPFSTIGMKVRSTNTWVVSPTDHNCLVPIGCIGELVVEGAALARGYLNDTEEFKKNAIDNPIWLPRVDEAEGTEQLASERRMFKTGDLVRYEPDGSLVYVGRKDQSTGKRQLDLLQVEDSIEAMMASPTQCIVEWITCHSDDKSMEHMVAFVLLKPAHPETKDRHQLFEPVSPQFQKLVVDLQASLSSRLGPEKMPTLYIPLATIPLTTSGRVDRQLLRKETEELPSDVRLGFDIREMKKIGAQKLQSRQDVLLDSPEADIAYWKDHLAGVEPCIFPSLGQTSTGNKTRSVKSELQQVAKLHAFCKNNNLHAADLFQVAWGLVLRCYTGLEEVCFGLSRLEKDLVNKASSLEEGFERALICRSSLRDELLVKEALQTMVGDVDRSDRHRMPLAKVHQALELDETCLFNTLFSFSETLIVSSEDNSSSSWPQNKLLIVVRVDVSDTSGAVHFHYPADSLSETHVDDIAACFQHVLNDIIRHNLDHLAIGDLDFLSDRSCLQLQHWNDRLPEKYDKCVHEIVEEQALGHAFSAPAICAWDADFTYEQLEFLSTRLSRHLVRVGVKPETFVALCFEKSAWAVVAQLAVLKAGGAFASIDPSHPRSRLRNLVEDLGARVVLCSLSQYEKASKICDLACVVNASTLDQLPDYPPTVQTLMPTPSNAAYAIFTSGTTGKPKATVIEHASLSTTSWELAKALRMDSTIRTLQFSNFTFDVSIQDTLITLMIGGCVCIPSEEERMNDLGGAIRRMNANLLSCTPATANTIDPRSVPSLKLLMFGGEKMTPGHLDRWADRCVVNAYGPSECTIVAAVSMKIDREGNRIDNDCGTIGRAVSGRTWVVDPHNHHRLLPVGAVGELILEGCDVARGYLNNEQKTKESFIRNPKWTEHPKLRGILKHRERMYRTGDLVRYNSDGTLVFISRKDTQIKLNGQRIELGEIEHQCSLHLPENSQVAVDIVSPKGRTMAKGLAVFFTVPEDENDDSASNTDTAGLLLPMKNSIMATVKGLRDSLTEALPQNMIPKLFFPVKQLPSSTSGKRDRKALRNSVESLSKEQLKPYVTFDLGSKQVTGKGMDVKLKDLWEKVLDLTPGSVSAEDSFFGLGGDSFAAMSLVGAAQSQGIALTVANIFKHPLLGDMAKSCEVITRNNLPSTPNLAPFSLLPKRAALDEVLEEVASSCCVPRESVLDIYPCSPVQEGLITSSVKQRGAYVARPVFRLADGVDIDHFKAAWQQTVNELDILRTRIVHTAAVNFVQAILAPTPVSWYLAKDCDNLPGEALQLPSYNGGSLTGYTIVESGPSRYFVWSIHHALYDGWSVPLILRKVEESYSRSISNMPTVPYSLFINYLQQRDMFESDNFWKSHLSNVSCPSFPPKKSSQSNSVRAGKRHHGSTEISRIPSGLDLTLPVLIRAAWAIVVSAHTGSSDVCFGETLMGRNINLPGVADIVGPVLTTAPTRIEVDNELGVVSYLQKVHQLTTGMIPHQHAGLHRIRQLNSDTATACDFQNLLVIQAGDGSMNENLWTPENMETSRDFFTYPLVIECRITKTEVVTTAHHDENIINSWLVGRLMGQFGFLLKQLIQVPKDDDRKLRDLELLSPLDRQEVARWNRQHAPATERCIHDLIEEQCLLQPDAEAICAWDGQLSYKEMWVLASHFAAHLSSLGVAPELLVPICMDKSVWTVVAILGIFIAGGAFVPLDPAHPTSRHEEILAEVEARILLCTPKYRNRYSKTVNTIISVDKVSIEGYDATNLEPNSPMHATSSNMAYALFTSGSTGRPKGIIIEHRAFASSAMAFGPIVHLKQGARVFQFASLTFDAAVLEILATLMFGGCICIPSEEERLNDIAGAIRRMKASWAFFTPSVASIIEPSTVPSMEVITCGGEMMSHEAMNKWSDRVKFINVYGPTETSVFATLNTRISYNRDPACIGDGIPSTLTWIVDPDNHDRLSPFGAIGELALDGPALAREYLKNPEKTAAAFITNPKWAAHFASGATSRRIYLTGDLVRYYPDGSLEYIARKDHQVKLHGQRMELGEIECRLHENSRVRHAIVVLPKTGPLQQRLVAVLSLNRLSSDKSVLTDGNCELVSEDVLQSFAFADLVEIQNSLESQLPIYMVPQTWAVIRSLPMLVSGKIDRKRITAWLERVDDATYDRIMQDYDKIKRGKIEGVTEAKKGGVPETLREICAQVLNLTPAKVNLDRSFVSLGGDSITGMALISRARKHGLTLSLHDILQSTSITQLAQVSGAGVPKSMHEEKAEEFFSLSPIQTLYFQSAKQPKGASRFNQSMTVQIAQRVEPEVIENALNAVVSRHAMLRARFRQSNSGKWQQKVTTEINSSYRFRTHSLCDSYEMTRKVTESQWCLDVQHGPILAVDLFDNPKRKQVLFLVANHLCVDMVSWRIILHDLQELIESGTLPAEKPFSFQAWCDLQMERSRRQDSQIHIPCSIEPPNTGYWGMKDSPNLYGQIKVKGFTLDEESTAFALGSCHETLRTDPLDLLLSVAMHSFHRIFSDRQLPTFYNEGHGRQPWDSSIDLSSTVGWFTTICPLHVNITSDDVLDTLRQVKDLRRKIVDNGQSYFAQSLLCPEKQPDSAAKISTPLEVFFNYLGKLQQLERDDALFQHHERIFEDKEFVSAGDMGSDTPRFALFELTAIVIQDTLRFSFTYNRNMLHEGQISQWVSECENTLHEALLRLKQSTSEPTPGDYPLLPISYNELKKLFGETLPRLGIQGRGQVEDIYPCTPMQEGLLLSQLREPGTYMFHTIFEVKDNKHGRPVDPKRLAEAWRMVVNRHGILRTIVVDSNYKGGSFDQVVLKEANDSVVEIECDDSEAIGQLDAINLQETNSRRALQLLQQCAICQTSTGRVLVKLEMNHAIIDGGSMGVLIRDLALAYTQQLPHLPGPLYSDYVQYVRTLSQDQALAHWKRYLDGVEPCHLPVASKTKTGRQLTSIKMEFDRFSGLQKLCERESVTLANLILSAWAIVLRSFTGLDDICFGYLSSGRNAPVTGIQDAVGIFINMLCCRVRFSAGQTLADIFKKVQADYLRSIPHQSCSLAKVQHELGLPGRMLFNTTLSIQNRGPSVKSKDDALSFDFHRAYDPSEYPVTVNVETARGHEGILLRYWSDAISETQAKSLANSIAQVFTYFIEDSSQCISELPKLSSKTTQRQKVRRRSTAQSHEIQKAMDDITLQQLIDKRVHDIVSQMLKTGDMTMPSNQGYEKDLANKPVTDEQIDQSVEVKVSITKKDQRRFSTASRSSRFRSSAEVEKKLLALWGSALGLSPDLVKHQDSFFRVGGDSIKAMKMASAAREQGLVLTVADVFRNPVFNDMLAAVSAANAMHTLETSIDPATDNQKQDLERVTSSATVSRRRLSLVSPLSLDAEFLQRDICPKIGFFKGGIADVLPVTDFQALSITATMFESRWMLNYFYLDGKGPLDLRRLRESCLRVVEAFDILRTVFVCSGDQFFQVILKKIRPGIIVFETDDSLDEFTNTLQQRDREQDPRQGDQHVQFILAKKKGTDHHRLLIRLSHAQFDGVCLSRILYAIKQGYEGSTLPPASSFASYMRLLPSTITSEHYQHWSTLLKGSRMTEIVRRERPNGYQSIGAFTELRKTIDISSSSHGNVTTATIMQAAWAMTLAKLSAQSDVVFGLTISGRNATIPGVQNVIGPCLNVIPVRVKFADKWNGLDLFRYIQDQQVANMPYECLGFREIIRNCTDWPDWTYFTTAVFHQNVEYEGQIQLDDNPYRIGGVGVIDNLADLTLVSKPLDQKKVAISLGYSLKGPIPPSFASKILDMVCETIEGLTANPSAPLPSPTTLLSLPTQALNDLPRPSDEHFLQSHLKSRNIAELLVHSDVLTRTWQQVLPHNKEINRRSFQLDSSFFDLGGDIVNMSQLTWLLQQEGLRVRIEHLLEHPTFLGQMAVLVLHNDDENDPEASSAPDDHNALVPVSKTKAEKKKKIRWTKALARKFGKRTTVSVRG